MATHHLSGGETVACISITHLKAYIHPNLWLFPSIVVSVDTAMRLDASALATQHPGGPQQHIEQLKSQGVGKDDAYYLAFGELNHRGRARDQALRQAIRGRQTHGGHQAHGGHQTPTEYPAHSGSYYAYAASQTPATPPVYPVFQAPAILQTNRVPQTPQARPPSTQQQQRVTSATGILHSPSSQQPQPVSATGVLPNAESRPPAEAASRPMQMLPRARLGMADFRNRAGMCRCMKTGLHRLFH